MPQVWNASPAMLVYWDRSLFFDLHYRWRIFCRRKV